jgi:hypothetical protein
MTEKNVLRLFRDKQGRSGPPEDKFYAAEKRKGRKNAAEELQGITAEELELVLYDPDNEKGEEVIEVVRAKENSEEMTVDEALFGPETQEESRILKFTRGIPEWETDMFPGSDE